MSRPTALVIGLARSGVACAQVLAAEGYAVVVADSADDERVRAAAAQLPPSVRTVLGGYDRELVRGVDLVCPSPGVRWDAPELELARELGIPVRSEIALVFERCRGRIVGITGTNGKTTTASLCAAVIGHDGRRVHLGGNIGIPMLAEMERIEHSDWVVLELSSFQLESVAAPRCEIAAVLNVTPDHLDRHGSMAAYAAIKQRVVEHATAATVLGWDDPITRAMAPASSAPVAFFGAALSGLRGATVDAGWVVLVAADGSRDRILPVSDIPLFGAHNLSNVLAAAAVGDAAGVSAEHIAGAVRDFAGVRHRLQVVADAGGVLYVNDSKATNPESAIKALEAFGDRGVIWIGGGSAKGIGAGALADAVAGRARLAILNGATATELDAALAARHFSARIAVSTLAEAVAAAVEHATAGDVVLLAPGYASFDQFSNFEERGDTFAALVEQALSTGEH